MSWSYEVETLLEEIRANSVTLSNRHRTNFLEYKSLSKYYDLPIIVVSTILTKKYIMSNLSFE